MEAIQPSVAAAAPYGRSCQSCVKAKCKCITRPGNNSCERCHRLGKECTTSYSNRRRKRTTVSLEDKLDGILSLLQSKNGTLAIGAASASSIATENIVQGERQTQDNQVVGSVNRFPTLHHDTAIDITATLISSSTLSRATSSPQTEHLTGSNPVTPASSATVWDGNRTFVSAAIYVYLSSPKEAENCLTSFRTEWLVNFAFIHLQADTTARNLHEERPFLFLAIMAVSSSSSIQRRNIGMQLKQTLAKEILAEEGSFDLLLGLLVFITWGHEQFMNMSFSSRFMQLAMSMVFDLRLNRRPRQGFQPTIFNLDNYAGRAEEVPASTRRIEERRAVLGCYVLSSTISWYFAKIDPLRWTSYMDECLQVLLEKSEAPSDEIFAHQVRLHLVAEKATQLSSKDTDHEYHQVSGTSMPFYLRAFNSQLSQIKSDYSLAAQRSQILLSYMHYTELCVNALAISEEPLISNTTGFDRIACLSKCLNSIKLWLDIFFTIPTSRYRNIYFPYFTQLAHLIVRLHRLSILDDPAWDRELVRSTVDVCAVLDQLIRNFGSLRQEVVEGAKLDLFTKLTKVFELVKATIKNKLEQLSGKANDECIDSNTHVNAQSVEDVVDSALSDMNFMEDIWLTDELAPWSYASF